MAAYEIESFALVVPTKGDYATICLRFKDDRLDQWNINIGDTSQFIAMVTLLRSARVFYDSESKLFYSGFEAPGSMAGALANFSPDISDVNGLKPHTLDDGPPAVKKKRKNK